MKKIFIIVTISFCFIKGFAQHGLDSMIRQTKFRIVRTTLEFLSTDKGTFPKAGKVNYQACNGYPDLIKAIKKDSLNGAAGLVEAWKQKMPTLKTMAEFSKKVSDTISAGKKSSRQQLPGYKNYMNTLAKLIDTLNKFAGNNSAKVNKPAGQQNTLIATVTLQPIDVQTKAGQKKDSLVTERLLEIKTDISRLESRLGSYRSLVYFLIVLFLAGVGYLIYLHKTQGIRAKEEKKDWEASLRKRFEEVEEQFRQKTGKLDSQLSSIYDKIEQIQKEAQKKTRTPADQSPVADFVRAKPLLPEVPVMEVRPGRSNGFPEPVEPRIKYAKYADLDNGFSNSLLQDKTSEETIFEITLTSASTASFKIANNSRSQKYALSNPAYLLSKACQYETTPNSNSTITTQEDGELRLEGANWRITERAKITFS